MARESLKTNAFAAAILDLGLPDIDGAELCSGIRRDGVETPILMLTARDSLDDSSTDSAAGPTTISPSRSPSRSCWRACGR